MPVLDWIGKQAVVNHHRQVPYRLLHCDKELSVGAPDSGNLIVEGDNLEALKALLPYYKGQVDCIFIDPPYNTGKEDWVYNDNVNSPEIRDWLGSTVGKEADDLSRHDKWLCMMYPRLRILREFLSEKGSFWMTLDDNESHRGKLLLDEIFGEGNFVANVVWQKKHTRANDAKWFSDNHDHVICYAKNKHSWKRNLLPRDIVKDNEWKNEDCDPRGPWASGPCHVKTPNPDDIYKITTPSGREVLPPAGTSWRFSREKFNELVNENRIYFGKQGNNIPRYKRFLSEVQQGLVPVTIWPHSEVGHNQDAKSQITKLGLLGEFDTPKPVGLIQNILKIATNQNALILDSFAGSGTTAHAVLKANAEDGGNRKFILVEMEAKIAQPVTAERVRRVINGYGTGDKAVAGLGGGSRYCQLGLPLFNEFGGIHHQACFSDLAAHIFFSETGLPLPQRVDGSTSLIGQHENRQIYLLFSPADQGFPRETSGNVLTPDMLRELPKGEFDGLHIVYAEGCTVSQDRLKEEQVIFKQIPYQIDGG